MYVYKVSGGYILDPNYTYQKGFRTSFIYCISLLLTLSSLTFPVSRKMLQRLGVKETVLQKSKLSIGHKIDVDDMSSNNELPDPEILEIDIDCVKPVFTQEAWDSISAKSAYIS